MLAPFPHHRLVAYEIALQFVRLIHETQIADSESRKHAHAGAASCARNIAEGAGRRGRADKQRCFAIAMGELCEAVACVEIDEALGGCSKEQLERVRVLGGRLNAVLKGLLR
jgi:four helix bundle protein